MPGAGVTYSFDESRQLVLEHLSRFGRRLGDLAARAFDEAWIDAAPRRGKGAGAYCMPWHNANRVSALFEIRARSSVDQSS